MRLVIQRVKKAQVQVKGKIVGQIGKGALVFFGAHKDDVLEQTLWLAQKLIHLRFFPDSQGKMNLSLLDSGGEALIVSQFTLYANCNAGRRPAFSEAATAVLAQTLYEQFVREVQSHLPVQTGIFGADMEVNLVNDGPVTLILDAQKVQ